jgi:uncharacterized membrane protein
MNVDLLSERSSWILVGATVISWAFLLYGYSDTYPWLSWVEVIVSFYGLGSLVAAWLHRGDGFPSSLGWVTLGVTLVAFILWCWIQIRVAPAYGTDESAFDQFAAQLVTQGHNPYTASMAPSFNLFHVSPNGYTFRLNGSPVTQLSYPALSFLLYVPFLLIGWSSQLAIGVNVLAWALAVIVSYWLLPRAVKPLAIVLGSLGIYTGFAVGGVTDMLYVPFLVVAVYQWDRALEREGWHRWIVPVAMGIALAIKQTPWFILPFLLAGLYLEAKQRGWTRGESVRGVWGYVWRTGVVFLVPNAVFIVASPSAWLRGVVTPMFGNAVPAGQGWVALSNFLALGGGSLKTYTILVLSVYLCSVVLFVLTYPRSKPVAILLASLVLFFSERSFSNYFVMLLLPMMVAATSIRWNRDAIPSLGTHLWATTQRRLSVVGSLILVGGALILVSTYRQPIELQIQSVATTGQLATVLQVTTLVTNTTGHSLHPIFSSESGASITAPWNVITGPAVLGAGASTTYVLQAPNFFAQPSLSGGFQMVALTESPPAMSVSLPYIPTTLHVNLNPEAVNKPVPVGDPVTFTAQILSSTNHPVDRAGVPVYLGQISYTQQGLVFGEAVINQGQIGQTPVEALTNAQGIATFVVTGTQPSINPVYFEANLVNSQASYPYGYSDIVPIRFIVTSLGNGS